jgi:hypothetical protein
MKSQVRYRRRIVLLSTFTATVNSLLLSMMSSRLIFASEDDLYTAIHGMQDRNIWSNGFDLARYSGRFYQTIFYGLNQVVYVIQDEFDFDSIRVFKFVFSFIFLNLLFLGLYKLLPRLVFLIFLPLFTFATNLTGPFNPLISLYPWFISGVISLVWSGVFFKYLVLNLENKKRNLFLSLIFFGYAAFSYEIYLLAFLFYMSLWLLNSQKPIRIPNLNRSTRYFILGVFLISSIYLSMYLVFRTIYPSGYAGSTLDFSLSNQNFLSLNKLTVGYFEQPGILDLKSWDALLNQLNLENKTLILMAILMWSSIAFVFPVFWIVRDRNFQKYANPKTFTKTETLHIYTAIVLLLAQSYLFSLPLAISTKYSDPSQVILGTPYTSSLPAFILLLVAGSFVVVQIYETSLRVSGVKLLSIFLILTLLLLNIFGTYVQSRNLLHYSYWSKLYPVWNMTDNFVSSISSGESSEANSISSSTLNKFTATGSVPFWETRYSNVNGSKIRFTSVAEVSDSLKTSDHSLEYYVLACGVVGVLVLKPTNKVFYQSSCSDFAPNFKIERSGEILRFNMSETFNTPIFLGEYSDLSFYSVSP